MQFTLCSHLFALPYQAMKTGKPKHCLFAGNTGMKTKILRIMRLSAFLILIACLQVHASGLSQGITLEEKDVPLEKVFTEIRKQSGYQFLFNDQDLKDAKKVSITIKNGSIDEVLKKCFEGQPLQYNVTEKLIVVSKKEKALEAALNEEALNGRLDVSGKVLDKDGKPLSGANVKVVNKNIGTITNSEGTFSLNALNDNDVLEVSYVGFETKRIAVKRQQYILVSLTQKNSVLDETVIVAYGTTTRRLNTGNTYTVKSEDIQNQPVGNPMLALQGRVPGLKITQSTGIAGGAVSVQIQGRNNLDNFYSGSDPLIIVDGVPYPSQNTTAFVGGSGAFPILSQQNDQFGAPGSTLSFLNPADIESIDILKDADATAIYGSRAANGAILVTTKKGKSGETKIDLDLQTGWGDVARKWDLLNREQYLEMRHEAKVNSQEPIFDTDYDLNGLWDSTRQTDWQKEMIGNTSRYNRFSGSISGGSTNTKYLIGSTYSNETTVFPGDYKDVKTSVNFNINSAAANSRFRIQLSGNYLIDNNKLPGTDYTSFIALAPVAPPLHNGDGSLNWALTKDGSASWENPLSIQYSDFTIKSNNLIANSILSYRILPGLELRSSFGYNNMQTEQFLATLDQGYRPERLASLTRSATRTNSTIKTWIVEPQISYSLTGKLGKFDLLAGSSFQETTTEGLITIGRGFNSDDLFRNPAAATSIQSILNYSTYRYTAAFGRINYSFNNRYLLNLAARRDGSSRFGEKNKFQNFGSVGIGWIFSEERFSQKLSFLSFGKLRGSFGVMGNDQIGDYSFMTLYSSTPNPLPYQSSGGLTSSGISNPYLQWEQAKKLQIGIELGFFNDRFLLTTNYFKNRSSNSLTTVNLPITTGSPLIVDNFPALIQNTGWEFLLVLENIKNKKFRWTTNINATIPQNKLISFPNLANSAYADRLIIGKPLRILKEYSFYGINPANGEFLLRDATGTPTESPSFASDRISLIRFDPRFYGGIQNSIVFKNFGIDFLVEVVKQKNYNILNINGTPGEFNTPVTLGNQPTTVLNRWQKPGDVKPAPRYLAAGNRISGDWAYGDASYGRLKNVSISYDLTQLAVKRLKLKSARVMINGQNVFTFTQIKGLDPETQSYRRLPPLRIITAGIRVTI